MTAFVIFGSVLILLATAIILAAIRAEREGSAPDASERLDAAVEALRELEFEYGTGKVADDEYRSMRARLEREALDARDALRGHGPPPMCPSCAADLTGRETFCPACGQRVASEGGPRAG